MPNAEKRTAAVRAIATDAASRPAAASTRANGRSVPTHAAAATQRKKSAGGWMMASMPEPPTAWPGQANVPATPTANATATTLIQTDLRPCADKKGTNVAARRQAKINRASQSRPKSVCRSTIQRMPSEKTSDSELSDMDCATSTSHAPPRDHGHHQT